MRRSGLDFASSRTRLSVNQGLRLRVSPPKPTGSILCFTDTHILPVNRIFADIIILHRSQCQLLRNVSLLAETLMVCPYFYSSTLVLISYSIPWSIRWKGCSSYWGFCLYNAQPDSHFPSTYAKIGGQTPCRYALRSGRRITLATTLG